MAYSKEQWERARGYYESGLTLSQITDKTSIARNTISQRAKREQWEHSRNADYVVAKELIAIKKGTEKEQSLACADDVADDKIRRRNLAYGAIENLLIRASNMVVSNKTYEKINIGDGVQQFDPRELNTVDLKNLGEAIDKATITLGINQRHATTNIMNTNAQQNETKRVTIVRRND